MAHYLHVIDTGRKCVFCDKPILTTDSASYKTREEKKYCSNRCKNLSMKEEKLKKSNGFNSKKQPWQK